MFAQKKATHVSTIMYLRIEGDLQFIIFCVFSIYRVSFFFFFAFFVLFMFFSLAVAISKP